MKRVVLVLLVSFLICSCQLFDRYFKGEVVAKVGNNVLYKSDLKELIPQSASTEDSIHIVDQYVYSWATKNLLLSMAEKHLPKEDLNIQEELDDYRQSLLIYKYEKLFMEQRLDTLITDEESEKYYSEHQESFLYPYSVVKARYVKISTSSPNLQVIRSLYRSNDIDDIDMLEELCINSAEKYSFFNFEWIPMTILAKELGMDIAICEEIVKNQSYLEREAMGYTFLVFFSDKVISGMVTPYEYNIPRIKEIIISHRKQELISNLEKDLLNSALNDQTLTINRENQK